MKAAIIAGTSPSISQSVKEKTMAIPTTGNSVIDALTAADANIDTAAAQCVAYIGTVPGLINAAVQSALAGGATAAQLAAVTQVSTDLAAQATAMQAALAAPTS
jgi:hypothetical protein